MNWRWIPLVLALVALALIGAGGPGYRIGLWSFGTGFQLLRWAVYVGGAAAGLGLVALFWPAGANGPSRAVLLLALAIGAGAAYFPVHLRSQARTVPPIHDISTDLIDPPAFVAILPLRANAANPAAYGGPEVAAQQREAYPDIGPLTLALPAGPAFAAARAAAVAMGWDMVAADEAAGRIEATATTRWFGFKDDVVIRLRPVGDGTRVDVRSVSRVGRGDLGTNAKRIRRYLQRLAAEK